MKQASSLWQAAGFALTTFGGTILHFLFDWTSGRILVSPFFRGERIHLGAYEAAVLAPVSLCLDSAVVFQGLEKLLARQS